MPDIWVNTGSGNSLLPDVITLLPEPMLTYHKSGPVTITWGEFHKRHPSYLSLKLAWKLLIYNFIEIAHGTMNKTYSAMKFMLHITIGRTNKECSSILETKTYQDEPLNSRGKPSLSFRESLIENLLETLQDRFPNDPILEASEIIEFSTWPMKGTDDVKGVP